MFWFYFVLFISLSNFSSSQATTINPDNCAECSPAFCPTTSSPCPHGTVKDNRCKCCEFCLKGPGEPCGGFVNYPSKCADGYYCLYSAKLITDQPGTCVAGEEIDRTNCTECSKYFCTEGSCKYGSLKNPNCDCCEVCQKGPGECCGGLPLPGICAEGYHCFKFYDSKEAAGVCVKNSSPDCCDHCPAEPQKKFCECARRCSDGLGGQRCGGFVGEKCPEGFYCCDYNPLIADDFGKCTKCKQPFPQPQTKPPQPQTKPPQP